MPRAPMHWPSAILVLLSASTEGCHRHVDAGRIVDASPGRDGGVEASDASTGTTATGLPSPRSPYDDSEFPEPPPPEPPRTFEECFDAVQRQMMTPPPASDVVLAATLHGLRVPDPPHSWNALLQARSGFVLPLTEELRPPKTITYVGFAQEKDVFFDVVRARYLHRPYTIDIAETRHLYSVRMKGFAAVPSATPLETAQAAAKVLFVDSESFSLVQFSSGMDLPGFGGRDPKKPRKCKQFVHWRDHLLWWIRKGEIGFMTVKGGCSPTPSFAIGPGVMANRHWFDTGVPKPKKDPRLP